MIRARGIAGIREMLHLVVCRVLLEVGEANIFKGRLYEGHRDECERILFCYCSDGLSREGTLRGNVLQRKRRRASLLFRSLDTQWTSL